MFSTNQVPLVLGNYLNAGILFKIHQIRAQEVSGRGRGTRGHLVGSPDLAPCPAVSLSNDLKSVVSKGPNETAHGLVAPPIDFGEVNWRQTKLG